VRGNRHISLNYVIIIAEYLSAHNDALALMDEENFKDIVTYLVDKEQIVSVKLIVKSMLNLAYKRVKMDLNVTTYEKDSSHLSMNSSVINVNSSKKDWLAMLPTLNNSVTAEKLYPILDKKNRNNFGNV
jgi:hypothetical protein